MKRILINFSSTGFLIILMVLLSSNQQAKIPLPPPTGLTNPIMFVRVMPETSFHYQLQALSNHETSMGAAPRGSSLNILYPDGIIRNLTAEAGLGVPLSQAQAAGAIAVRQPCVHWSGTKALVSILVGGQLSRYDTSYLQNKWQIYEVTGFGQGQTVGFTKIANQPNYNNISPAYAADGQILFISDAPVFMKAQLYPQLDEYESATTVTGIFKLNRTTGKTVQIEHSASGVCDLTVSHHANDGRVFFTKWDHLKRDQQADLDRYEGSNYRPADMSDESASAQVVFYPPRAANGFPVADNKGVRYDLFPEARNEGDPTWDKNEPLLDFNHFMFWEINDDGSGEEVINHAGRHEFGGTFTYGSKKNDPNLTYIFTNDSKNKLRSSFGADGGMFQVKEDPYKPGTFYGIHAKEFGRCASGRVIEFSLPIGKNPDDMDMIDWTNRHIDDSPYPNDPKTADMTGHYRNPLMVKTGATTTMLVSHTPEYQVQTANIVYKFRMMKMVKRYPANTASTEYIADVANPLTGTAPIVDIKYNDSP